MHTPESNYPIKHQSILVLWAHIYKIDPTKAYKNKNKEYNWENKTDDKIDDVREFGECEGEGSCVLPSTSYIKQVVHDVVHVDARV